MPTASGTPVLTELVVGLDDEAQKIIDLLTRGTKQLDIVSIVGMPGLGKTTLAKKVYNDPSIIYHFHVRIWCTVSQVYDKKSLLLQILGGGLPNLLDKSENDLAEDLYRHLKGKRYLIILDDVWDTGAWNSLKYSFPDDAKGNRILFTSRHENVALEIKPDSEPHRPRFLTNDESCELLQKNIGCPPALHALAKEIAQHCKGLPLTILIVAGILSNTEQDAWKEVGESLKKGTVQDLCTKTLELSYYHLPDYLKPCFLYFGAFEEDQEIPVQKLLSLWVAEGFVMKNEKECLEQVAEDYMMDLIQRSLVMVAKKETTGRVKSCILHDLLRDFCVAKGRKENFLHWLNDSERDDTSVEPNVLYRLCVFSTAEDFAYSRPHYPHLRSLFLASNYETWYERLWYDILYKYCQSRLLRVLDLRGIGVRNFLPRGIELLIHLRYLALAIRGKLTIRSSIDNLQNLETFLIEFKGYDHEVLLPDTVWNMKKLRHLCINGPRCYWKLPEENYEDSSNLENLHCLSTVHFSSVQTMNKLMRKFPNIRRLKCIINVAEDHTEDNAEDDVGDCKFLALDSMSQLKSLSIEGKMKFIDLHFMFPQNLKKLVLSRVCLPWSKISAIEELPNLEILELKYNGFTGDVWDFEEGKFPKLRFLKLKYLRLVRWMASEDSFPCLEKLVLDTCTNLKEVPSCLAYISTLEMVEVSECKFAISSIKQLEEVHMDAGNEDLRILIHPSKWDFDDVLRVEIGNSVDEKEDLTEFARIEEKSPESSMEQKILMEPSATEEEEESTQKKGVLCRIIQACCCSFQG